MESATKLKVFPVTLQWLLTAICALAVANLYYDQVLLSDIANSYHVPQNASGLLFTMMQVGYTLGLLFIVPLGDRFDRRKLIVASLLLSAFWLAVMTIAPSYSLLLVAALGLGLSTVAAQLIIPYVSSNMDSEKKGAVTGRLLTGVFLGVLVGRVAGGWIGQMFDWRTVHWLAAGILLLSAVYVFVKLPEDSAKKQDSYTKIMLSMIPLLREEPVLRETIFFGAAAFAAFNVFWVPLSFILSGAPYHFGNGVAGSFGIIGIAGALAAGFAGRLSDGIHARGWNVAALLTMLFSFVLLGMGWYHLSVLIAVTFVLDVGSRMNMTLNQGRISRLNPGHHSRLNSLYMVGYYLGGSFGSWVGTAAYHYGQVSGMIVVGCLLLTLPVVFFLASLRNHRRLPVNANDVFRKI
ncbi:Predicted arabinose efflux permease, MFS family [Paenibacillus sophorae]|uniref:MFS transporter n=1 Tax=Paenibacillus sophorae TaxID=1333845 RepID=A0A1H8G245_9BACL|nr:MFS transporter [Paenibacillus sophorae]QWU14067.1 MFS transporter [Paenibacillus sophorae]SEN38083.1 Predicted arabinose efflux permease, MFS family [Paenibacillus sophorae]